MQSPINTEEVAVTLGISKQSLELRMRRLIPKMSGMGTPNDDAGIVDQMDRAEAKLLGLLDLSTEEMCALMRDLGMTQT